MQAYYKYFLMIITEVKEDYFNPGKLLFTKTIKLGLASFNFLQFFSLLVSINFENINVNLCDEVCKTI